jgi:hypothetical protein
VSEISSKESDFSESDTTISDLSGLPDSDSLCMRSPPCVTDSDTWSVVHADWDPPGNRFGTDDEDALAEFEAAEAASNKRGPTKPLAIPPLKRASIGHSLHGSKDRPHGVNHSATDSRLFLLFMRVLMLLLLEPRGDKTVRTKGLMTVLQCHLLLSLS